MESAESALACLRAELRDVTVGLQDELVDSAGSVSAALLQSTSTITTLAEVAAASHAGMATTRPSLSNHVAISPSQAHPSACRDEYAVPLEGGDWRVWRTVGVRGAGFPTTLIAGLTGGAAAAAADEYLKRRREVTESRAGAARELGMSIRNETDSQRRAALRRVRHRLRRDAIRAEHNGPAERLFAAALERRATCRAALDAAYEADWTVTSAALVRTLEDASFREAVLWQKRPVLHRVGRKLRAQRGSEGERRNAALFVAMAVQRYATKNDTIGFFGPIGWAEVTDRLMFADVVPGPHLLARREVFFEGWAVDAVARRLDADPTLKPWASPRLKADVWIGPDAAHCAMGREIALSAKERELIGLCDGVRTARRVAEDYLGDRYSAASEAALFETLERLVSEGLLSWSWEVASQQRPEQEIEERVGRIGDRNVRARYAATVRDITDARARVAHAAGSVDALDEALGELDAAFARVTGRAPTRREGEMYAARGLVFEDCRRDCEVRFGSRFMTRLGPPLSIVLDSARWVTTELRWAFTHHLQMSHAALRARLGTEVLDAHLFVTFVSAGARAALAPLTAGIRARLQQAWRDVLDLRGDERSVHRTVSQIRARALEAFACAGPSSWGGYFTPDILIGASGVDALARGDFQCVLGEVHSNNTLLWSCLTSQHPDRAHLQASLARDTHDDTIVVVQLPKQRWLSRLSQLTLPDFWRYEYGDDLPARAPCRSLPAGLLVAVDDGVTVSMRAKDGRVAFDAYELFAVALSSQADRIVSDAFCNGDHAPRVSLDDLIISRERWELSRGEMPFVSERQPSVAFALVRAWARSLGMPRHVFYKSPDETKPCYLDFDSVVHVESFLKLMRPFRPAARVKIVEMQPDLGQTWLIDRDGARYTSEIRIVAKAAAR